MNGKTRLKMELDRNGERGRNTGEERKENPFKRRLRVKFKDQRTLQAESYYIYFRIYEFDAFSRTEINNGQMSNLLMRLYTRIRYTKYSL